MAPAIGGISIPRAATAASQKILVDYSQNTALACPLCRINLAGKVRQGVAGTADNPPGSRRIPEG
ncbi:MAG TPA: hypothetical protein PK706_21490 [Xanthobacteraceae bacterium]|nr:hypothetical protein [Xanthobacteraceae bacterium]